MVVCVALIFTMQVYYLSFVIFYKQHLLIGFGSNNFYMVQLILHGCVCVLLFLFCCSFLCVDCAVCNVTSILTVYLDAGKDMPKP